MAITDLVFEDVGDAKVIYDPLRTISGVTKTVRVTNRGSEDLSGLGIFLQPATSLGDIDYPADSPPETDYQDLLTWGSRTDAGVTGVGGLKLTVPQNDGSNLVRYVTRTQGSKIQNKITFKDLPAGDSAEFQILLETPPGVTARRLYINLVLE